MPGGKGAGKGSPRDWQACLKIYGLTEEQALAYPGNPIDNLAPLAKAGIPLLHIVGTADEVVPVESVRAWLAGLTVAPEAYFLPGVGHFFHQRLADLQAAVRDFVAPRLPG